MAAERYLSRRIPDLRVGNNIDEIDKKLIPASIHPCNYQIHFWAINAVLVRFEEKKSINLISKWGVP